MSSCMDILSELPKMAPMTGVAVALCLAYLNLERFRYRSAIARYAREILSRLENNNDGFSSLERPKSVKLIRRFASLTATDEPLQEWDGWWGWLYTKVFEKHFDRRVVLIGSGASLTLLCVGVGYDIGLLRGWLISANADWFTLIFYCLMVFFILLPISLIWLGQKIVAKARTAIDTEFREIEIWLQDTAKAADIPDIPSTS